MTRYANRMGTRFMYMLQMAGQIVFLLLDILRCLFSLPGPASSADSPD